MPNEPPLVMVIVCGVVVAIRSMSVETFPSSYVAQAASLPVLIPTAYVM